MNLILLLIHFEIFLNVIFGQDCDQNLKFIEYKNDTNLNKTIFLHFNSFEQLNSNCSSFSDAITNYVEFIPEKWLILDNSFSPKEIFSPKQMSSMRVLNFFNLKGVDILNEEDMTRMRRVKTINLGIFSSRFDFYSNRNLIDSSTNCSENTFNFSMNFLNSFDSLKLVNTMYPSVICSYAFKESKIKTLIFTHISNSFLLKNRLYFQDDLNKIEMKMLKTIYFNFMYETLDTKNLNAHLFAYLSEITVSGVLYGIQVDLFSHFFHLKTLDFQLDNLKEFFHASNNQWMASMNGKVTLKTMDEKLDLYFLKENWMMLSLSFIQQLSSFNNEYVYPDEDLCFFKYFPHKKAVFPFIIREVNMVCTCTIYWLHYYAHLYR